MIPRPYQQKAIDEIRNLYATGCKKVLLQLATGGGKTFIFSTVLKGSAQKGKKCVMLVRGRSLVDQASRRLDEIGVPHGVFMANHKRFDQSQQIQICSIDTVRSRQFVPEADIIVIDEAHYAVSDSFKKFLEYYPDKFWLSVTATPWVAGGLKHLADKVVYPISFRDLCEQKYLVPPRYFAPTEFDDSKIKTRNGEFDENSALVEFEKQSVYGDVISAYRRFHGPALCFAINLAHAENLFQLFTENDVRCVKIDAKTPLAERLKYQDMLASDQLDMIINVGTMTTGVDIPCLRTIIFCRPTQSKNLYIQMIGRGTRPYKDKENFVVLDHVGNVARHGFIEDESVAPLDIPLRTKKSVAKAAGIKTCKGCYMIVPNAIKKCPTCGYEFVSVEVKQTDSELQELALDDKSRIDLRAKYFYNLVITRGYKIGFLYLKLKEEFGDELVRKHWQVYRKYKRQYEGASGDLQRGVKTFNEVPTYENLETEHGDSFSRWEND